MSEYPWDIENMMLAQHDQPCDCAICDEIHFNRETRRQKRRTATDPDCLVRNANAAWERATGANYPAHAEAIIKGLQEKLKEQSAKCNIYNCMDRKDLKLRIAIRIKRYIAKLRQRMLFCFKLGVSSLH